MEIGVLHGDNIIPIVKKFPNLTFCGVDPYLGSSFVEYYKGEIMGLVYG